MRAMLITALAVLIFLPAANAQQATASVTLAIADPPQAAIPIGGMFSFNVTATGQYTNTVCGPNGSYTQDVTLAAGILPSWITVTVPPKITITWTTQSVPGTGLNGGTSTKATVTAKLAANAPANHNHMVNITGTMVATAPQGGPTPCTQPQAGTTAATNMQSASFVTGAAPAGTGTSGSGSGSESGSTSGSAKSFALPGPVILGVLLVVGLANRRRL